MAITGVSEATVAARLLPEIRVAPTVVRLTEAVAETRTAQRITDLATQARTFLREEFNFNPSGAAYDLARDRGSIQIPDGPAPAHTGELVGRHAGRVNVEGYSAGDAPSVLMYANPAHNATRAVFNSWRREIARRQGVSISDIDWEAVSPGEAWRLAEEQIQAAGTSSGAVDRYFTQWNEYLNKVGWSN